MAETADKLKASQIGRGESPSAELTRLKNANNKERRAGAHEGNTRALRQLYVQARALGISDNDLPPLHSQMGPQDMLRAQQEVMRLIAGRTGQTAATSQGATLGAQALGVSMPTSAPPSIPQTTALARAFSSAANAAGAMANVGGVPIPIVAPPVADSPGVANLRRAIERGPVQTSTGTQYPAMTPSGEQMRNKDGSLRWIHSLPNRVPATVDSQVTDTGVSAPNLRGERTLQTPGGPVTEVNPREDRMQSFIPRGDSLLPSNAAGGMVVDPRYRPVDGSAVASVSYGPTPTARTGRIFDENGDQTGNIMQRVQRDYLAAQAAKTAPAVNPQSALARAFNPTARSAEPVGPVQARSGELVNQPQMPPALRAASEAAAPKVEPNPGMFSVRNFTPPPASRPTVTYGPPGPPVFKVTGDDVRDAAQRVAGRVVDATRGTGFEGSAMDRGLRRFAGYDDTPAPTVTTPRPQVAGGTTPPAPQPARPAPTATGTTTAAPSVTAGKPTASLTRQPEIATNPEELLRKQRKQPLGAGMPFGYT